LKKILIVDVEASSDSNEKTAEFSFWACGQNTDISKAKGSAETYASKYLLSKIFLIPIRDLEDPDYNNSSSFVDSRPAENEKKERINDFFKKHGIK
jgi:hypothetical protein